MRSGEKILELGFFTEYTPAAERISQIKCLEEHIAWNGIKSRQQLHESTQALAAGPAINLLNHEDPRTSAPNTYSAAQLISKMALELDEPVVRHNLGVHVESAIHNFLVWGVAHNKGGRYARAATMTEDASSMFGQREGYDMVYRTDQRRWKIQVKSTMRDISPEAYKSDVIVISPDILMRDSGGLADNIHEAIVEDDHQQLSDMWHNFIYELRNQKATSGLGYRQVI